MAAVNIQTNARGWREVSSAAHWTARVLWPTASAVYAVVQDSGATPKVRVLKGNSYPTPTSFSEQDSANNKAITNVDYPYDSWLDASGFIHVIAFSATNTLTHYRFNTATDLWTTGFGNISTAVENEHTVRCVVRSDGDVIVTFTSSADDCDLGYFIWQGANWTTGSVTGILAVNNTVASNIIDMGIDSTDRAWVAFYDCGGADISYLSINSANTVSGTVDIEATGPAALAQQSGSRFNMYVDGSTDKIIAAYIPSGGNLIQERIVTLEADANSGNLASENAVEATTTDVGARTPTSTAVVGSTRYVSWWDDASSGTIKYSTWSGSAWNAETNFATSITKLIEIVPYSNGLAVVYQNGTTVTVDWIVATYQTFSRNVTTTAVVTTTEARTVTDTAVILETLSRTATATAAIFETFERTVTSTAAILETLARTVPSSAVILTELSNTVTATAVIETTFSSERTVLTSAVITEEFSNTVTAEAVIAHTFSLTIPFNYGY